jgi:Cupin-like domain
MSIEIASEWRAWVIEALESGVPADEVRRELLAEGVPDELIARELAIGAAVIEAVRVRDARLELALDLLAAQAPRYIARRTLCSAAELHDRYFTACRPVVFTDGCARMAAAAWSFAGLRERLGDVELEIGVTEPVTMRLAAAIDVMLSRTAPRDFYVVSRNRALADPLRALTADLAPLPEFLHPEHAAPTANLWMGPAGTLTGLHHDTTHVYFCQLVGRKRYRLVAPWTKQVLRGAIRGAGDSDFDLDEPGAVPVHVVELGPGESLFIPAGWWHEVYAREPSISVSMRAYIWPADFDWYQPARLG